MSGNPLVQRLMDLSTEDLRRELFAAATGRRSYGEVREGMLAYAGWLSGAEGIRPGDRVAICLPKTLETVQLIYGILAAGAAYVPLQYQGPPTRLGRILAAIRPALFITTIQMAAMLRSAGETTPVGTRKFEVDDQEAALAGLKRGIPSLKTIAEVSSPDLATVFFTSGSTGDPKGVMWAQRTMGATLAALPRWWQGTAEDRLISVSGLHYAASFEIFYPVISTASVYLCSDRETFADHLAVVMECQSTTILASTATALRMLLESGELQDRNLRALRRVAVFGERMPLSALRAAMNVLPHAEFWNVYSATEAFDMVHYTVPRPLSAEASDLPLGYPHPAYELSLRDERGEEVGPGEVGEICVVGPAVTIGYWNDPELSRAKRLADVPDSYRTGDIARQAEDGLITLVGRKDHQAKLRGHRFDLGEIEAAAKAEPRVREAVAFIDGAAAEAEVVLAVLTDAAADERKEIERAVWLIGRKRLPRYARPGRIVMFSEFPLLSSGKIDRGALKALIASS